MNGNDKVRKMRPLQEKDLVWDATVSQVRRTGTGPTRLADWLPIETAGPVLLERRERPEHRAGGRQPRPWTWVETLVLAGYALVVAVGLSWHEPWADEAQAWLLARDSGWWPMMLHSVRYEGSPGLWHTMLWVLARLHVSFTGMHWIAGAIACAGIYLLLRHSPFPLILRILLPFGFWLAYQDAVVARSYVLFAVLAFGAAAMVRGMMDAPARAEIATWRLIALSVLLGLMANLSVHGLIASVGFAVAAMAVLRRRGWPGARARLAIPALVLCCFWAFAVVTTIPPQDVNFQAGTNVENSAERIWAKAGDAHAQAALTTNRDAEHDVRPGELAPIPPIKEHWTPREALWHKVARVLSLLTFPVSNFRWLALLACGLAVAQAIWFGRRRDFGTAAMGWTGLLPWALMVVVFTSMYLSPRHAGMLWTALVAALWLTWPADHAGTKGAAMWLRRATLAALVLVAIDQTYWTVHAVRADVHGAYSGDEAMAKFLREKARGKRIAGFYYYTVGPAAWFRRPLYFNQPHAWWLWSRNVRTVQQAPATIAKHPDVVVVGGMEWGLGESNISDDWIRPDPTTLHPVPLGDSYQVISYAEVHGYHETHRFCGRSFMRDAWAEELCEVALEPR